MSTTTTTGALPHVSVEHIAIDSKGIARIAGSRSRVSQIVVDHRQMSAEGIVREYPHLKLADVYAALTYYYDHREQIEHEIEEGQRLVEELRPRLEKPELIEKLRERARKR
jgi:uncharacterized protein (DUF433 family)